MTSCWTAKPPRWVWGWAMSDTHGELTACLKELHLPTARVCYQELAESARREELSYEGYLLEVMQRECQLRRQHRTKRLLRESRLPVDKSLGALCPFGRAEKPERTVGRT